MIWAFLVFCIVTGVVLGLRSRALIEAAYYEGYRRAIQDASEEIRRKSDRIVHDVPAGRLIESLERASLLGDVRDSIRELSKRIGRPV